MPGSSYLARSQRYVLAAAGPVAVAGANFCLSFSMLRLETPGMFGTFTFLFTAALFTIALSNALFGAPMQALFASDAAGWPEVVSAVASSAIVAGAVAAVAFALLGMALGLPPLTAACYGAFGMLTILRCVGRAWSYAVERPWRVTLSDMSYAFVTLGVFAAAVGMMGVEPAHAIYPALTLGAATALAGLGNPFAALWRRPLGTALRRYGAIWRAQSSWSLLSVIATEAGANAHIYLLTLFAGGAAVAPVAAGALLLRPLNVLQNALSDYERPQIARFLEAGAHREVDRSLLLFRAVLLLVWVVTVALAAAILTLRPSLIVSASYDLDAVRLAAALWAGVTLVILLQLPANVLLQSSGAFRRLSAASVVAAGFSVTGVLIAIAVAKPVWSIAAIGLGWFATLVMVLRAADAYRRQLAAPGSTAA
jgi:hypothetical protein